MTPEQLNELRRQRTLMQQHLDRLDREIAAASPSASIAPHPVSPLMASAKSPAVAPRDCPEYEPDPSGAGRAARRGCLLYAALALALLGAALVALYFWRYRDRPVLFAPAKTAQALFIFRT